jgi:hypothetical protein
MKQSQKPDALSGNYAFFFGFLFLPSFPLASTALRFPAVEVLLDLSFVVVGLAPLTLTTVDMPCLRLGSALLNAST